MQRVSSSGFWILTLRLRFWICLCSPFSALFHVNSTEIKIQLWIDSSQEVNQTRCGLINWVKGQHCRYVLGILDKQKEKRNSILDVRHELVETRYRYKYWIIYSAPVPRAWVIFYEISTRTCRFTRTFSALRTPRTLLLCVKPNQTK